MYPDGEICWISDNSDENKVPLDDSKGYDIRYKILKSDIDWNDLEVKSISGDSFIKSSNEVKVGIENKNHYHLALVRGSDIHLVSEFFMDEERVTEFNTLSSNQFIRPLDYDVNFRLSINNSIN